MFVIPTMLIGAIDFYHFLPISVTLTLAGGHKISTKQNLLAPLFAHFSTYQDEIGYDVEGIRVEHPSAVLE